MKIIEKKVTELIPYENNPRVNSHVVDVVKASIQEFGFKVPIVIDENNVIVTGHTRLKAALKLNMDVVPCIIASDLTKDQIRAFRLVDNKTSELSFWNEDKLNAELTQITLNMEDFSFDIPTDIDFNVDEITEDIDHDNIPEKVDSRVKAGDIWLLGRHRLMCGDSTVQKDVDQLMDGKEAEMLFTSPPYSDMREYHGDKNLSVTNLVNFISTFKNYTKYQVINLGIKRKDHDIIQYWDEYIAKAKEVGYKLIAWNVWKKTSGAGSIGNQRALMPIVHEWLFVFGERVKEINKTWEKVGDGKQIKKLSKKRNTDGSYTEFGPGNSSSKYKKMESVLETTAAVGPSGHEHPAIFPVILPEEYIKAMTENNEIVIDPFMGSGTTMIAAEKTERVCYGMELDNIYCDIVLKRWETITGLEAKLIHRKQD